MTLVEALPNIHEDSITVPFAEYNKLVELASSKSKTDSGALAAKSLAGPSFLGLREPDAHLKGSAWGAYNASFSRQPGWGTPAWSTSSSSDSDSSSPSKSSFSLSFCPATLLPSSLPLDDASVDFSNQNTIAQPSNAGLLAVNASSYPNVIPQVAGSKIPTQDNEREPGQGAPAGAVFEVAITEPMAGNNDVPIPPTHTVPDREANPPPYVRQEPEISFIFDDITGDWDPYPTIFLPRPQHSAPAVQEVHYSFCPHSSPVGYDATYLVAAQGSKTKKDKNKGTDTATPCKCACHEDNKDETAREPAPKKSKLQDTIIISDNEHEHF
ncbi:hypothetical protein ARMGADRAFT_1032843 [Armillaria gallica]|uniref:Uncharacterized protein n=1 Tax=Armillaria gallica TaxID=47427 RepID=A0A2H3DFV7_ARMGA|nr:hypothetical protein ARMGADRAFT_1032843 [Armillaria gallica]